MEVECFNWTIISNISIAVIALCALVISIWQGIQMRAHNRKSYRPHLTSHLKIKEGNTGFIVELINNGIGPAIIDSFHVFVDKHLQAGEDLQPLESAIKLLFPNNKYELSCGCVNKGYAMAQKEIRELVNIKFVGDKLPTVLEMDHAMKRASIDIKYQCFYGIAYEATLSKEKI
jgi:hypothetical protein